MGTSNQDGPDGSSIRPVSSLLARFENMSKPGDAPAPSPNTLPAPLHLSSTRPISPGPKPDRLREPPTPTSATAGTKPAPSPKPKPKPRDISGSHFSLPQPALSIPDGNHNHSNGSGSVSGSLPKPSNRGPPPPPVSPRPHPIPTPSLLVQPPPLSPPKSRISNSLPLHEQPSFLKPDSGVSKPPLSPSPSPRQYRIPSRSLSPNEDLRKSPRLGSPRPPSPPPPRRSAELRRERDHRELQRDQQEKEREQQRGREEERRIFDRDRETRHMPPPPIKRADKPRIVSQQFPPSDNGLSAATATSRAEKRSSYQGPPRTCREDFQEQQEQPPSLPTRPRPQVHAASDRSSALMLPPPRPKTTPQLAIETPRARPVPPPGPTGPGGGPSSGLSFEPPPVHHSVASRRIERDYDSSNGSPRQLLPSSMPDTPNTRPKLPSRPQTTTADAAMHIPGRAPIPAATTSRPPPSRRMVIDTANGTPVKSLPQKRVVSSPTTSTTSYPPPPSRAQHGRSMTIDRTSSRAVGDFRSSSTALAPAFGASSTTVSGVSTPVPPPSPPRSDPAMSRTGTGLEQQQQQQQQQQHNMIPSSSAKVADTLVPGFPDVSRTNRRPPYIRQGVPEIGTRYDTRVFDVCGDLVCTTGHLTRVWSLLDGEQLMSLAHGENTKATAVAFRPGAHVDDEGTRLWIGTSVGELMEADIATQSIACSKPNVHSRYEVIKIHRHYNELWTLDESGSLLVWGPDEEGNVPSLAGNQDQTYRVPRGHTFSMVVGDELWHATGKELRVFLPTLDGKSQFQVLLRALTLDGAGEISAGTVIPSDHERVYFGHTDGKVSIYSRRDYACVSVVSLGSYKIHTLSSSCGGLLWAGYSTGRICVYDQTQSPWTVRKEWTAHDSAVTKLLTDLSSSYRVHKQQVVSLGADNVLRVWDGLLEEDWLEDAMHEREAAHCDFETIQAHVMTWNAGASTPGSLRSSNNDEAEFLQMLQNSGSPDILVFGFQELVDLEDKTATAKRFLKPKKKDKKNENNMDQEKMSHQYRDWRDFLVRCLDDYMGGELYHLLQTAHMVGLFTCIFVKADLRNRIRNLGTTEVKRGMGGLHGNKGAIVVRFQIDDSSLCFVNCHLAAGQTQAAHRHNDVAAILETSNLAPERDAGTRLDVYVGGGDGSMILDHEMCILNGDLNYRIDTMSRDTVVAAVHAHNLAKLLDRDQLLVARRRNAAFRLRVFRELPISFAPTYKYDVGTDTYDSSEKKRSPAWCDRLLFRGPSQHPDRLQQLDYRRYEVHVSDHRPVAGRFALTVKRVDPQRRAVSWLECQQQLEHHRDAVARKEKMFYLTNVIGYDTTTSKSLIDDR